MAAYEWKTASHIKANADIAGKQLEELGRTVGVSAETVLEANRPENAPLHDEFEWNDGIAAEKYRLGQARHIINCLCVKVEKETGETEQCRAFFQISETDSTYEHITAIIKSEDKYAVLLRNAYNELAAFKKKYEMLKEIRPVINAIQSLTAKQAANRSSKRRKSQSSELPYRGHKRKIGGSPFGIRQGETKSQERKSKCLNKKSNGLTSIARSVADR